MKSLQPLPESGNPIKESIVNNTKIRHYAGVDPDDEYRIRQTLIDAKKRSDEFLKEFFYGKEGNKMNELIKIEQKDGIETVNARELHAFLESKQQFTDWIKNRIEKFGFVENQDYTRFHNFMKGDENGHGNKTIIEYHISIDMAKELSMVENNDKGREARRYFIEVEKKHKAGIPHKPVSIIDLFRTQLQIMEELDTRLTTVETNLKDIKENRVVLPVPEKAEDQLITPTEIGQIFTPKKSAKEINEILRDLGYQYKVNGQWVASVNSKDLTYTSPIQLENGRVVYQMYWKRKIFYIIDTYLKGETA